MHVLLHDNLGRLTLRRLRPWHRVLGRSHAARLDRELADGTSPEARAMLVALPGPASFVTKRSRAPRGLLRKR